MPRSREDIEAEIAALQAELAELASIPDIRQREVQLGRLRVVLVPGVRVNIDRAKACNDVSFDDAELLRDWLNYHFPKTEENA